MKALNKSTLNRSLSWLFAVLAIFVFTGCATVGPDYVPPDTPVSATWHTELKGGLSAGEMDPQTLAAWWTTLNDPELSSLIDRAVLGNLDLKKARHGFARPAPAGASPRPVFFPLSTLRVLPLGAASTEMTGSSTTSDLYAAGFDAGWELDIFGGVRRSVEAAEADLQASQEDLRNVLVSLLAEVALNYIDVRTYQVRIAVAEANLEAQSETYQLTQWRYEAGLSDELAVQQARYNLENTRSLIPALRTGLEEAMNRIAVLLGEQPGKVHPELEQREPIPVTALERCGGRAGRSPAAPARCATGRAPTGCPDSQDWCGHGGSLPQVHAERFHRSGSPFIE